MEDSLKKQGRFSWNEFLAKDVEGAKWFYSNLLGWELEDLHTPDGVYTIARAGGKETAGIMAMPPTVPEGTPPHWAAYVTVDDVDTSIKRAEGLGGKVVFGPKDIPDVGRFCVIQDPQGAHVHLISYVKDA